MEEFRDTPYGLSGGCRVLFRYLIPGFADSYVVETTSRAKTSDVLNHFPHPTWTDASAKATSDAEIVVHHIFIGTVSMFHPADGVPVTGRFAHPAIPARSAGHTPIG